MYQIISVKISINIPKNKIVGQNRSEGEPGTIESQNKFQPKTEDTQ